MFWEEPAKFYPLMELDLTQRCNLRCKHCYFFRQGYEPEAMSDEELLEKLKVYRERHGIRLITYNGGEPMLRKEFIKKAV